MNTLKDNSSQYIKEIKQGFDEFEPGNNGIIESQKLNELTNIVNSKRKYPFVNKAIKKLTAQKEEENDEIFSLEEYVSFIDNELNDINSKEGLKKIFSVFCDENNQNSFSWIKLAEIAKKLGDNQMENKILTLLEQAKLFSKDLNFKDFYDIMNEEYESDKNMENINIEDYEDKPSYKQRKKNNKKKDEEDEIGTISSKNSYKDKNEESKKQGEDIEEKSSKRYHRRYRDNKTKNDNNNENGNNKLHSKYRKKY